MLGISTYLWRLLPANPILLRVVESAGKRRRDLFIRCGYLGLLLTVVIFSLLATSGNHGATGLKELSDTSISLFHSMSYLQLGLVALLAPVFTAGAITQEKDSQTYDILLSTPLTNGQIVLGSLLSRLFFVIALLISGIPIFSITQVFGGVAIQNIVLSFAIAAATAFVTGALAMVIATFKVGTRRTIFSFYMFVVVYLVGIFLLDQSPKFWIVSNPATQSHISWFTGIHPFLALHVILNDPHYLPPDIGALPEHLRVWPIGWYLTSPQTFYIALMFTLSAVLVLPSIVFLRRVAQSSINFRTWLLTRLHLARADRTRAPRPVWHNPIAWREARTRVSAARSSVLRYAFIVAGLGAAVVMAWLYGSTHEPAQYLRSADYDAPNQSLTVEGNPSNTYVINNTTQVYVDGQTKPLATLDGDWSVDSFTSSPSLRGPILTSISLSSWPRSLSVEDARRFLLGAIIVEFAVILLIVTNAAASTVTREKEDGTLDLLLTTPITSRYYIWGKLRGLVSFVLPLLAVPVASVLIFILYDFGRLLRHGDPRFQWLVFPEALLIVPGMLVIVTAFAAILGMQMSLRCRKTIVAVMSSVGIVTGICATLGWCGFSLLNSSTNSSEFNVILGSFSPFTLLTLLINPYDYGGGLFTNPPTPQMSDYRLYIFLFSTVATGIYAIIVWTMYKSMVKNFDMTIRRQSR